MTDSAGAKAPLLHQPWPAYVLPYVLFLVLTEIGGLFEPFGPLLAYPVKLLACTAALVWFARKVGFPELRGGYRWALLPLDVGVGLAVFAVWIAPESIDFLKIRESSFDPHEAGAQWLTPLLVVRLAGAVLLVPVMEELLMRSFLPRWLDMPQGGDWRGQPIGKFTLYSFVWTVILFGAVHNRWAVGLAAGVLYNGYLAWRRSLLPVIVAHAVTNLALGIYVLRTELWTFW